MSKMALPAARGPEDGVPVPDQGLLVCPRSKLPLRYMPRDLAKVALGSAALEVRSNPWPVAFGATETVLVREDNKVAYPVCGKVPILLWPEQLTQRSESFDLSDLRYAEAYAEMDHYNRVATEEAADIHRSDAYGPIRAILALPHLERLSFPEPKEAWLDCVPDCAAQYDASVHLGSVAGRRVMQLGGKGIHAVKFLLAGAAEAWVLTPMLGEAHCSIALAIEAGVADRLRCIVGVAEELPVTSDTFDLVYSGGCVHHMSTELAFPEIARVLRPDGRFSAIDPWRAPFYAIGTKLLGKREVDVFCRPLTPERVRPLFEAFRTARTSQYGTLIRYPVLALSKCGLDLPFPIVWWLYRLDAAVTALIPGFRRMGSSVALFGEK